MYDEMKPNSTFDEKLTEKLDYSYLLRLQVNRINLLLSGAEGDIINAVVGLECSLAPYLDDAYLKMKQELKDKAVEAINTTRKNKFGFLNDGRALIDRKYHLFLYSELVKLMSRKGLLIESEGSTRL